MKKFEKGTKFYDAYNDRYITTTDDPRPYSDSVACDVVEWDYDSDKPIEYSQHFSWIELSHFELRS